MSHSALRRCTGDLLEGTQCWIKPQGSAPIYDVSPDKGTGKPLKSSYLNAHTADGCTHPQPPPPPGHVDSNPCSVWVAAWPQHSIWGGLYSNGGYHLNSVFFPMIECDSNYYSTYIHVEIIPSCSTFQGGGWGLNILKGVPEDKICRHGGRWNPHNEFGIPDIVGTFTFKWVNLNTII